MKTKTIKQTVTFGVSPHEVYEALMDEGKHAEFTGAAARVSREVGGTFSVWDGGISGKNLELVPDKKIVQEWYCETGGWPKGHYSLAVFILSPANAGTRLSFIQTGVPEASFKDISKGWKEYYWTPMVEFFST